MESVSRGKMNQVVGGRVSGRIGQAGWFSVHVHSLDVLPVLEWGRDVQQASALA